jgi:hypothetical protein
MIPITPGLSYTWVNNQVLVYEVTTVTTPLMVEWSNHVVEQLSKWLAYHPLQVLYNLSHPKVITPYMVMTHRDIFNMGLTVVGKKKVEQVLLERATLFGRLALLIPDSASGEIVKIRAQSSPPMIESGLFTDYDVAMAWLTDMPAIRAGFRSTVLMSAEALRQANAAVQQAESDPTEPQRNLGLVYNNLLLVELEPEHEVVIGRQNFPVAMVGEVSYTVSRIHAQLERMGSEMYLIDFRSTNGTRLNGQPLNPYERMRIQIGDEIRFGSVVLKLGFGDFDAAPPR